MSIDESNASAYRWYILGLSTLTNVLAFGVLMAADSKGRTPGGEEAR